MAGETDQMASLRPLGDRAARSFALSRCTRLQPRAIPSDWLTDDQLAVPDAFQNYVRPVVGELSHYPRPLSSGGRP